MNNPIPSTEMPQCEICKLDPVPSSAQHILFLILQIAMIFVNWKLSIILLMVGYSFPRLTWKCPFCSRQVVNVVADDNIEQNIIFRMGNCMALFSLSKFRIFAVCTVIYLSYLFIIQPIKVFTPVTKSWQSLVQNCGYQANIENSVKSNHLYKQYINSGFNWEIQGIYLYRQETGISSFQNIFIKMDPTQYKDPNAFDFRVFTNLAVRLDLKKGDILRLKGQWEGAQYPTFIFNAVEITKTSRNKDPQNAQFFYRTKSMLRSHFDGVRDEYEKLAQNNEQIIIKDKQNALGNENQQNPQPQTSK